MYHRYGHYQHSRGARKRGARRRSAAFSGPSLGSTFVARSIGGSLAEAAEWHNASGQSSLTFHGGNGGSPFPDRYFHRLRWNIAGVANNATGSAARAFKLNSPYQPSVNPVPISGDNAVYFTTMGRLYSSFFAHASRISVTIDADGSNSTAPLWMFIFPTIVAPTSWSTWVPPTYKNMVTWINAHKAFKLSGSENAGFYQTNRTCSMFCKTGQLSSVVEDSGDFIGQYPSAISTATDPQQILYWGIWFCNLDGTACAGGEVTMSVTIDYWMESFCPQSFDPAPLPQPPTPPPSEAGDVEEDFEDMAIESEQVFIPLSNLFHQTRSLPGLCPPLRLPPALPQSAPPQPLNKHRR